ncbi:hypothetical protein U27_04148 [Candidatus Vecturithrix granuli]|uniref:Uncharacterized protein n=1 Tax=Vecturithrix granuli TaxID=1499967 RepID=A0A081BXX8_VECG1|nr:hypothetical protein U27_04148 [Candidatus Vecturithrix granuli]
MRTPQKAIPALREFFPQIGIYSSIFLIGCAGTVLCTNGSLTSPLSQSILGGSLLLIALVAGAVLKSWKTWKLADELDQKGVVLPGKVMALWQEPQASGKFLPLRPRYYMLYAFDLSGADALQQFAATQIISPALYQQLKIGMSVRLRVLLNNPNISRMETSRWKWNYPVYVEG